MPLAVLAGLAFGLAYLVNPLIALFPLAVGVVFWRAGLGRHGAVLAAVCLLFVVAWGLRPGSGSERAYMNLVQGSWPLYHAAYVSRNADPEPARIMQAIGDETNTMLADHAAGFAAMRDRMSAEPAVYARWYASKVYLLWDWDIRIGEGGVYVHPVYKSPLEIHSLLRATTSLFKAANPWLFALSLAFALWAAWKGPPVARLVALAFLYVTGVHLVLQAEPRYAVPYRSLELLLVVGALDWLWTAYRVRFPTESSRTVAYS